MKLFKLTISSPDGKIFDGEVESIMLRGAEGDLAVLAGHIPFITSVQPGKCTITLSDGSVKTGSTDGGILAVAQEKTTLFSGSFRFEGQK